MCRALKINSGSYYYEVQKEKNESVLEQAIIDEFARSINSYGKRKLKPVIEKRGFTVSRRPIGRIIKKFNFVSKYNRPSFKPQSIVVNLAKLENTLNREIIGYSSASPQNR